MTIKVNTTRVKDVMSRDVVSIHADETLHAALDLMAENRVVALPVVNGRDQCVGMLSASDLIEVARDVDDDLDQLNEIDAAARGWLIDKLAHSLGHEKVNSLMSDDVATVKLETSLHETAREMLRNRVHRVPVVDDGNRLMGIVSTMDLLEAFANGQ